MELYPNLENVLNKVNNFINIDAYRQIYTDHFSDLRKTLFNNLRNNKVFSYMFNGFQLAGSYGDNVKVSLPNEFDLVFHITFPEQALITVLKDDDLPGNVFLDFTKVLQKINKEKQHEENLKYLMQWLNNKNFLKIEKFQSFIQSCFVEVLSEMENQIPIKGQTSNLRYERKGPAHTIHVQSLEFNYSVDFVPGILLKAKQAIIPNLEGTWEAIPKPSKINHHNCTSFRTSYYQQEHNIIKDKKQLKNVYRMLKKFRDNKTNMLKMKSYFIKTLFLFKADREDSKYWTKPLTEIIIDMFKDWETSLREENLPFFWNEKLNLYEFYSSGLLREMLCCVKKSRETLEKAAIQLTIPLQKRVYYIFLNKTERNSLDAQEKCRLEMGDVEEIKTSFNLKFQTNEENPPERTENAGGAMEASDENQNDSLFRCIIC